MESWLKSSLFTVLIDYLVSLQQIFLAPTFERQSLYEVGVKNIEYRYVFIPLLDTLGNRPV